MSSIPRISKSIIAHWTDNVYFQRGEKYYEQGAIYEQRIQGMTIKSNALGRKPLFIVRKFYSTAGELNPQNVPVP